jgi:ketosteroid isomerase-like protein
MERPAIREFVERWFNALGSRDAEALVEMCNPDVAVRPFLARKPVDAVGYYGHDGIRQWVESLDSEMRIRLELIAIEDSGPQSAVVEAEVWYERDGGRSGGLTFSLWRFDGGKLSEAVGYGSKEEALDAESRAWH